MNIEVLRDLSIASSAQWVVWRPVQRKDKPKPDKVPYSAVTGQLASVSNPKTWATFEKAEQTYRAGGYAGLGFVLTKDLGMVGVDLDYGLDGDGKPNSWAEEIVTQLASYTEVSQSGKGLHVLAYGQLPGGRRQAKIAACPGAQIEMYSNGRYLVMTGDQWPGAVPTIEIRRDEIEAVHTQYMSAPIKQKAAPKIQVDMGDDPALLGAALGLLAQWRCDTYDSWLKVGMALHPLGDIGYQMWDTWSQKSQKYDPETCYAKWQTFTDDGPNGDIITPASLRRWADEDVLLQAPSAVPVDWPLGAPPLTDVGNGERLARTYGGELIRVHSWGWMAWTGNRWMLDLGEVRIMACAKGAARRIALEANGETDPERQSAIRKWALASEFRGHQEAMIWRAGAEVRNAVPDDFDADPWLLGCSNGTVDLRTGAFLPPDPKYLITKQTGAAFDPGATCPRFELFLGEIFRGHPEMIPYLQRWAGLCLTGDTTEKNFHLFIGAGNNGKSTLMTALRKMMGDYAATTRIQTFLERRGDDSGPSSDVAALCGARLVIASEVPANKRLNESLLKDMTGKDPMSACKKFREPFNFVPKYKLLLFGNSKPVIAGTDLGIWDRVRLIPFDRIFSDDEMDKHLDDKLAAELPGILNWAIRGCLAYQRQGLGELPAHAAEATTVYHDEEDIIGAFLNEQCRLDNAASCAVSDLYTAYRMWCIESGYTYKGKIHFSEALETRGIGRRRGYGNALTFYGICVVEQEQLALGMKWPPDNYTGEAMATIGGQSEAVRLTGQMEEKDGVRYFAVEGSQTMLPEGQLGPRG